jgi:hypothetical protein
LSADSKFIDSTGTLETPSLLDFAAIRASIRPFRAPRS